ncbi:MAG: hypothetical protein WAM71_13060 [Candidatus Korobacteraceae bacterium]
MLRALLALSLALLTSAAIAQSAPKPNPTQTPNSAQAPNSSQTPYSAKAPVKKNPLLPYVGNWIGAFEDKPWILLTLNLSGEQFSGSLERTRKVDLNDNGEIKHVSDDFVNDPLVEAKLNPDGLLISVKDPNTQEVFRYMMKLSSDEKTAEIKMIAMNMPPGMAKPKPWKLMKVVK